MLLFIVVVVTIVVTIEMVVRTERARNPYCKVKSKAFVYAIEVTSNLGIIILVIFSVHRVLDLCDMCMFCDVCTPLHHRAQVSNGRYDVL
jgi:heme/copper-type cytochrome/quinol oxidase subunit 1